MPGLRAKKSLLTVFFILIMIFGNFAQMKAVTPNDLNLQTTQASWSPGNDETPTTTIINTITNTTEINVIHKSNNTSSINSTFNNNSMSSNNNSYNNNTIDAFNNSNNNTYDNKNNTLNNNNNTYDNNNNTYDKNNTLNNNNNNNTYDNKNNTLNNNINNTYNANNTLNNNNNNTYDNKNNTLNNNINNTYNANNTLNNNNNNTYDNKNNTFNNNSNYDATNNNFYNNSGKNNASLPSNNSTESINNTLSSIASEQVNISQSLKNISNPAQKNSTNVEGTNRSQIGAKASLSPLSQYLVNLLNNTMQDYILHKNQTTATKVSPQDLKSWLKNSNQTDTRPLVSNSSTTPSSLPVEHCSILPNFVKICHLPIEYQDGEDSMTTFEDLEDALSNSYIQYWLSSCQLGKWCLSQVFDSMLRDSLNISEKFCSKIFLSCLRTTTDNYTSCANYEKYKILRDSLELICGYKTVESEQNNLQTCGFHSMKLISTILSDFKRKVSPKTDEEKFCETQKGFMMTSFNCLLKQCSPTFQEILLKLETWKWFTENRTLATTCQTYYECLFTSTTTKSPQSSFSFTRRFYRTGESSTRTSWNFVKTTTGTEFKGDNQQNVDVSKIGVEEEEMDQKYHFYKKNNEENSHMVASLTAMMAILMIGMSVVMIFCWRHFKRNGTHKRIGYSKLKTDEC